MNTVTEKEARDMTDDIRTGDVLEASAVVIGTNARRNVSKRTISIRLGGRTLQCEWCVEALRTATRVSRKPIEKGDKVAFNNGHCLASPFIVEAIVGAWSLCSRPDGEIEPIKLSDLEPAS